MVLPRENVSILLLLVALLAGCVTPAQHADRLAAKAGFARSVFQGDKFHHVAYARITSGGPLFVYLEGDGRPWIHGGREINTDPTGRDPLALELAARSDAASILYLGRPCYLGLAALPECHSADWTFDRYSADIVRSLAVCINRFVAEHGFRDVVLIGHSGGGTLALLMAPQVMNLRAVITVAGNLDVKAWTAYHGYLPLQGSLDPADTGPLAAGVVEIHLTGGADTEVPASLLRHYLAGHPGAHQWTYPRFGHRCCWQDAWPELLPKLVETVLPDHLGIGRPKK
jgi:pimeloyl-ACP methyl ester carboxylesterase